MIPKLYDTSLFPTSSESELHPERSYLGTFSHLVSCEVTEEKNGNYTLELQCTIHDECAEMLIPQRFIEAKPNPVDNNQYFEITKIERTNTSGIIKVSAQHIVNILYKRVAHGEMGVATPMSHYYNLIYPISTTYDNSYWDILCQEYLVDSSNMPFNFYTRMYKNDTGYLMDGRGEYILGVEKPATFGEILGKGEGSILDHFGGAYYYDNLDIAIVKYRGSYKPYRLRYGQNIGSSTQSIADEDVYTYVMPYGNCKGKTSDGKDSDEMYIYGCRNGTTASDTYYSALKISDVITGTSDVAREGKTYMLDLSDMLKSYHVGRMIDGDYTELYKVQGRMYDRTVLFIKQNTYGMINTGIDVKAQAELDEMLGLELCDTVDVVIDKFGISVQAEITKVIYDVPNEKWKEISIGQGTTSLADYILKGGAKK